MSISQLQAAVSRLNTRTLHIGLDTSGSTIVRTPIAQRQKAINALAAVCGDPMVSFFDTQIFHQCHASQIPWNSLPQSGGGTDFNGPIQKMLQSGATAIVIFSDMMAPPAKDPGVPVLWVAEEKNPTAQPFGTMLVL